MNKIVSIGSLLVGFQANVEQKILPIFRFVQWLLLSAMFIVGLSITPINAAVIQVSFTGPTFDRADNNGLIDDGGTFVKDVDKVSGFFRFNDDDLTNKFYIQDDFFEFCRNCFDVNNFGASAGKMSISGSDSNTTITGGVGLWNGDLYNLDLIMQSGEFSKVGDERKTIMFQWGTGGRSSQVKIERCASLKLLRNKVDYECTTVEDPLDFTGEFRQQAQAWSDEFQDIGLTNAVLSNNPDIAVVVPEPSIIALFTLGLVGIGFARRRRS